MKKPLILIASIFLAIFLSTFVFSQTNSDNGGIIGALKEIRNAILEISQQECEFEEYNFEKDLDIFISQEFIGSGAIMTRYYDFLREDEVLNGEFNLIVHAGNPTFITENALIEKSGQVSEEAIGLGHNWLIEGNEDTNLGSGPEKSLNFWFMGPTAETSSGTILSHLPFSPSSGTVRLFLNGNIEFRNIFTVNPSMPITNDVWHMVTIVRVDDIAYVYFNGELVHTDTSILQNLVSNYSLGYIEGDSGSDITGLFDEMSFWSDKLTQDDIDLLYNGGSGRVSSDLNGVMQITEVSDKILIPQEFEYSNFKVIEADIDALCVGDCSYSINGVDCEFIEDGFNEIPQECLDSLVGGFNTVGFEVDTASHGEISNLRLNSQVKPANC
jgi:hypothetical protein